MAKAKKRPAEAWTYVLKADRALPLEAQSRFTLRPMTFAERAAVRDDMLRIETAVDGARMETSRVYRNAYEIVLSHVVAIENFPAGAPAPWPDNGKRGEYIELLDDDDVLELGNEVWMRSTLGVEEPALKNSSPPERTSNSGGTSADATSTTAPVAPSGPP